MRHFAIARFPGSFLRAAAKILLAVLCLFFIPSAAQAQISPVDAKQEAVYLRKFLQFVQWSPVSASNQEENFQFCVAGEGLLGFALADEMKGTAVHEHKVVVRHVKNAQDLKGCQAVVFGGLDKKQVLKAMEILKDNSVLTFGQTSEFLEAGGVVQLIWDDGTLRFGFNLAAARKAGVRLDARVLTLAKRVLPDIVAAGG
jgi:hypothetical protein